MIPTIGKDHSVPADDVSVRLMPTDDPVPSQVQVSVNESAPSDHSVNCRGMELW